MSVTRRPILSVTGRPLVRNASGLPLDRSHRRFSNAVLMFLAQLQVSEAVTTDQGVRPPVSRSANQFRQTCRHSDDGLRPRPRADWRATHPHYEVSRVSGHGADAAWRRLPGELQLGRIETRHRAHADATAHFQLAHKIAESYRSQLLLSLKHLPVYHSVGTSV